MLISAIEKLPLISISFQKAYKSAFLVRFVVFLDLIHLPLESSLVVVEMPGMQSSRSSEKENLSNMYN